MKKSNFNYNNQYYNSPARSRYSSRSSRRLQSECGSRESINSRNRFYHRIEKACTTFSSNDVKKEVFLYRKQIQRLEKQVLKKDKVIFQLKESNMHNKELEAELIEVYRVLYMYEGKIGQCEKEIKKLQKTISAKVPEDITQKVQELLESYRVQNSELSGELQEKNRIIMELEGKLKKTENKYFSTAWKLSSTKRQINNPLKKRFPNLRNTITLNQPTLLEKEKMVKHQNKPNIYSYPSEYQLCRITDFGQRGKQSLRFKKVEASHNVENTPSPTKPAPAPTIQSSRMGSQELYSFSTSVNNINQAHIQKAFRNDQNSRPVEFSTAIYTPNSIKPVSVQIPSSQNLSSQMTISNTVNPKKVEYREYRQENPQIQFRGSTSTSTRYQGLRTGGGVQGVIADTSQGRSYYVSTRGPGVGQSIYLK